MFRPERMLAWTRVAHAEATGNCLEEEQVGTSESLGVEREKYRAMSGS